MALAHVVAVVGREDVSRNPMTTTLESLLQALDAFVVESKFHDMPPEMVRQELEVAKEHIEELIQDLDD